MFCSKCGTQNPDGNGFCYNCGTRLERPAFKAEVKEVAGKDLSNLGRHESTIFAIPLAPSFNNQLANSGLRNWRHLPAPELQVMYRPYYFTRYNCFPQIPFARQLRNIESKGTVVIDSERGEIVDSSLESGVRPTIQCNGLFVDCEALNQRETSKSEVARGVTFTRFESARPRISESQVDELTQIEIAKNLSQTFTEKYASGKTYSKTLRPYADRVRIISTRLMNIPIVTATFSIKSRKYYRTIQAATAKMIADGLSKCGFDQGHASPEIICEECGVLACGKHGNQCQSCDKLACKNHLVSRGLVFKKYYCPSHVPKEDDL